MKLIVGGDWQIVTTFRIQHQRDWLGIDLHELQSQSLKLSHPNSSFAENHCPEVQQVVER